MPHSFDHWCDTEDAMDAAFMWASDDLDNEELPDLTDRQLLERFLATPDAADRYRAWCDDLIADHADRQQEERRDR
jgi:hypothetical protein